MLQKLVFFLVLSLAPLGAFADPHKSVTSELAPGRVIIAPRPGLPAHHLEKFASDVGGKLKKVGQSNVYILENIQHGSERGVAARLNHNPHFKFAEVDERVTADFMPNDPLYMNAWHLQKIGAADAWDTSQGLGVTIAILDSGADLTHPDLATSIVPGWNFYDNNSNTADVFGHGTAVAGAAAAILNNAVGVSGIAGKARIMPIRVAGTDGYAYTSMIVQGITYAADHGAKVANASFGNIAGNSGVQSAAQYMKGKGGLVVVAAGNTGTDLGFAESSSLISASATDGNDVRASWSSFGGYVDVAAPGVSIYTTSMGGGYYAPSGTSVASPVTAGVVALIFAANSSLSNSQVEKILFTTATDLGDMGRDSYYGYGRVNAAAAVLAARSAVSDVDVQAPTVAITSPYSGTDVSGLVPVNVSASDNVGVSRVELRVNGSTVAVDTVSPFAFSWDSTGAANGPANLAAYAIDAAGNFAYSSTVTVNVANTVVVTPKDTTAPTVRIINPVAGNVSGKNVPISVSASDDSSASGITIRVYIDDALKASANGSTLGYNWNLNGNNKKPGYHVIKATATDAAGNTSTATVTVNVLK